MQGEVFSEYWKYLMWNYGQEDAAKIFVLKTAIIMYPLVPNIQFSLPVGLVTDSVEQIKQIFDELSEFADSPQVSLTMTKRELKDAFAGGEYEAFFVTYFSGKMSDENLQYLAGLQQMERMGKCIVLVGFCGGITPENLENLSGVVYLKRETDRCEKESKTHDEFTRAIIQFVEKNQNIIFRQIRNQAETEEYREGRLQNGGYAFFSMAELVSQMMLEDLDMEENEKSRLRYFVESAKERLIAEFDSLEMDEAIWENRFRQMFLRAAQNIRKIVERTKVYARDIEDLSRLPLCDERYYYISENMLRDICSPWLATVSFLNLKNIFANQGIIVGEGKRRNYFTVKITVITEYGGIMHLRMVKIPREKIDRLGFLTWQEMILAKGEDDYD